MTQETETKSFPLGQMAITPTALDTLHPEDVVLALMRHSVGDWGDCCPNDAAANDASLEEGTRLLSVYQDRKGRKFWVITEADRSATTVLLPEEY